MKRLLFLGLIPLTLSAHPVQANGLFRSKQHNPTLVIEVDANAKAARLIVPRRFLAGQPLPAQPARNGFGSLPTIMVGTALAMSIALGGLWLVRRRPRPAGMALPVVLALCVLATGAAAVWADLPVPFWQRRERHFPPHYAQPPPVTVLATLDGVQTEMVNEGDTMVLVLTPAMKAKLGEAAKPAEK